MRLAGLGAIEEFARGHADAGPSVRAWAAEARAANWQTPQDIKDRYAHASFRPGNRVVFNIKGNDYRLVVRIEYRIGLVQIERIGTHAEYNRWKL